MEHNEGMVWWIHYGDNERIVRGGYDAALDAQDDLALKLQVPACDVAVDRIPELTRTQETPACTMAELVFASKVNRKGVIK
jgi:hypothetical protein